LLGFQQGLHQLRQTPCRRAWPWFLLAYVAMAAGLLLKGPLAVVLPLAVLTVLVLVECRFTLSPCHLVTLSSSLLWGIPLVLALTVPWFWWANQETGGEFFRVFFWFHHVERGLGNADATNFHPL